MPDWTALPSSFLNLTGVETTAVMENLPGNLKCSAVHLDIPCKCPQCGQADRFHVHEKTTQVFHDAPLSGRRVVLELARTRWKCPVCAKTWLEALNPDVFHEKRSLTTRAWKHIRDYIWDDTFARLGFEMGIDAGLVRRLFLEIAQEYEMTHRPQTPRVMGIDEVHLAKKARGVLLDLETGQPYDLLEDATRLTFSRRFLKMQDREKVEIVTMDQTAYYRRMVREFFPNAVVIADKWHVLAHVDRALATVRTLYRDKLPKKQRTGLFGDRWVLQKRYENLSGEEKLVLDAWTANHPTIGLAYALKEGFYKLYDLNDRAEAERGYETWKALITKDVAPFRLVAASVDRWRPEVFNYFDHGRYTNAKTERLNGRIKEVMRSGRGYGFDILRAKILFKPEATLSRRVDAKADDWRPIATG